MSVEIRPGSTREAATASAASAAALAATAVAAGAVLATSSGGTKETVSVFGEEGTKSTAASQGLGAAVAARNKEAGIDPKAGKKDDDAKSFGRSRMNQEIKAADKVIEVVTVAGKLDEIAEPE